MKKLTSCILAILLTLCAILPVQATATKDGKTLSVTGLFEGYSYSDLFVIIIFDGKKRHKIYANGGLLPPKLSGKLGYTVRVEYKDEKLDDEASERIFGEKNGSLPILQNVTLISGKDDPELCEVYAAAVANDSKACNTLGVWYEKGKHGLPKDPKKAVAWYRIAASDNPLAMHNLGDCYRDGIGVKKDEKEATRWYKKAIEAGNPIGYEDLGNLYLRQGKRDEARSMYQKAASAGRKSAQKKLEEMK